MQWTKVVTNILFTTCVGSCKFSANKLGLMLQIYLVLTLIHKIDPLDTTWGKTINQLKKKKKKKKKTAVSFINCNQWQLDHSKVARFNIATQWKNKTTNFKNIKYNLVYEQLYCIYLTDIVSKLISAYGMIHHIIQAPLWTPGFPLKVNVGHLTNNFLN